MRKREEPDTGKSPKRAQDIPVLHDMDLVFINDILVTEPWR
jgi:hypothetical protein